MIDDPADVPPVVIAAHEAGHAVMTILFGGEVLSVELRPGMNPPAWVSVAVVGVSNLGRTRIATAGLAGEEVATGHSDAAHAVEDYKRVPDARLLVYAHQHAMAILLKYRNAFDAVHRFILDRLDAGGDATIPGREIEALIAPFEALSGGEASG